MPQAVLPGQRRDQSTLHTHSDAPERIRTLDAELHAWTHIAYGQASLPCSDDDFQPLKDMLFGVKDVLDVSGMPTRCGSSYIGTELAARDASCVAMLRKAGAIPIGKTRTAEFAYRVPPATNNPAAPGHTPGGSSSGSAAAVAAHMVPFALSTQTGGSIIRPAAYCGTVGFKPSFGLISRSGLAPGCESLDTIGWHAADLSIARNVADVLLGKEEDKDREPVKIGSLRVRYLHTPGDESPTEEVRNNLDRIYSLLRHHGSVVLEQTQTQSALLELLAAAQKVVMHYELSRSLEPLVSCHPSISAPVKALLVTGKKISRPSYLQALAVQAQHRPQWDAFTGGADIILAPSAPSPPCKGLEDSGSSAYCRTWSFLGWPCLHLPIGSTKNGLPIGFQIVTPWQRDFDAFQAADSIWRMCVSENHLNLINH